MAYLINYQNQLYLLYLIQNDLKEILDCLRQIEKPNKKNSIVISALWKNVIISYAKKFTKSDDGYSSLEKRDCIKHDQLELHEKIMNLRNSFIAHRGENDIEKSLLLLYEEERENGQITLEFVIKWAFKVSHLIDEIKQLVGDLMQIVETKLRKKIEGMDTRLMKELNESD